MKTCLVASSKGGAGKTTIATRLAALAALAGLGKRLFDYHSWKVRERQHEWSPVLKWLRREST